jgi:SPOR domain
MTIERSDSPAFVPDLLRGDTNINRDAAELGERLLDDAHTAWLIAEGEASHTLDAWRERGSGTWYRAYVAAVEREEAAARDLERLHQIASPYLRRYAETSSCASTVVEPPD